MASVPQTQFTPTLQVFDSFAEAEDSDAAYFASLTPEQCWQIQEQTRQMVYGYDPATVSFQRSLEVVERT